jgi:hypothetical protein
MFSYPHGNESNDNDVQIILDHSTINTICSTQTHSLIEIIRSCSITFVDVTECQGGNKESTARRQESRNMV